MAQAQKKLRENSNLQSSLSQNWSAWKTAMVPLYNGANTVNRHQNQVGFIWKYILNDRNLIELCGIYEWRAVRQDQPNRVIYVGIEARAHVVAILNNCGAESLGTAVMVIIRQL